MSTGRDLRRVLAFVMAAACTATGHACAATAPTGPQAAPAGESSPQSRVPGEYLVTVAAPAGVEVVTGLYGRFGIKGVREIAPNVFLVTLTEDPGPATMEALRKGVKQIKAVEPNYLYRSQGVGTVR